MLSSDDPLSVFQLLAHAGVPFVIIGGHAVVFHGYVRTTEDAEDEKGTSLKFTYQ